MLHIEYLWILAAAPVFLLFVWICYRQQSSLGYSSTRLLKGATTVPLGVIQKILLSIALISLTAALAGPYHEITQQTPLKREGRDIVVVFDRSGSMAEYVRGVHKLEIAVDALTRFVRGCAEDRLTLISFNQWARLDWPPSFAEEGSGYHDPILRKLDSLSSGGSTDIPLALNYALEVVEILQSDDFDSVGQRVVVLVSDGISVVDEEQCQFIIETAARLGTTVHWIYIESRTISYETSVSGEQMRMIKGTIEATGGQVFKTDAAGLEAALKEIDRLETAPLAYEEKTGRIYHYRPFVLAAFIFFSLAAIIEFGKEL